MEVERITEPSLYPKIKLLVEDFGELTTAELKEKLKPLLDLSDEDKEILAGRNDRKIDQIIRNVGAHAEQGQITYKPGFAIDKTGDNIIFRPLDSTTENHIPTAEKTKQKKTRSRKYQARKVDYSQKSERDQYIGLAGELLVVQFEQDRLKDALAEFNPNIDVYHLSQIEGDGAGYDIQSKNDDGTIRRIEVKTTTSDVNTSFYMSENERSFMEEYKEESTFLYRVYNFNKDTGQGDIKIITAEELLNNYNFDCITYKVTPKVRE
jgi:hypothetical protein